MVQILLIGSAVRKTMPIMIVLQMNLRLFTERERVGNNDSIAFARSASTNESTDSNQNMIVAENSDDEEVDTTVPKIKPEKSEHTNETDNEPEAPEANHDLTVCCRH